MTATDDVGLVARAKAGDDEAFGELVTRHQRAMFAIARAYFASEADAEDGVQEAFVKAFEALDQLSDNARFAAWLARITVNACLATLRARTDKMSLADFASTAQLKPRLGQVYLTPSALASRGEEAEQLKVAIGRLPEAQRVAVMLHYAADMTYDEMAAYLDVPYSTIVGRLHTAKQALKQMLTALDAAD
jgi:RNA polymerase sigma-70 factor (ECF subfamily)